MGIKVSNLTKHYGVQKAIDQISFTASAGEITGLIGPNGAGKTTTMKILTCFMPPDSGTAELYGYDIHSDATEIKRMVGYLPEHNPLYGNMYLKEYLNFVAGIHGLKNPGNRIKQVIEMTGLGREQHKQVSQLSKGYKQRVGLAQAIIHDPKVLILDEPISGLDPNQLTEIRTLITELRKDKTIIFSSHILSEVESVCDRVIILSNGKIVRDDSQVNVDMSEQSTMVLHIELMKPVENAFWHSIEGVGKVEALGQKEYIISTKGNVDCRPAIFDQAASTGNRILQMTVRQESLENIFKKMTREGK